MAITMTTGHGFDFDSPAWYDRMAEWSDDAAAAGDVETMLIAEIAQGHTVRLQHYTLDPSALLRVESVLSEFSPRLAACRIAAKW